MAWYWQLFPSQGTIKYNTCHTLIFFNDNNRYWVSSIYYETDVMEYFAISWVWESFIAYTFVYTVSCCECLPGELRITPQDRA